MGKHKELILHITAVLFITFVLGIYVSGSGIDVWAAEEVRDLDCTVVIDYTVMAEFGEYRKDSYGNPTDDRCDNVTMNLPTTYKIPAKVKAVRHENGATDYSVVVNADDTWSDSKKCWGTNYTEDQGSYIVCKGTVTADNLTISGTGVGKDKFDSNGYIKLNVTDAYKNSFNFGVKKLYDTNPGWVIDKWDYNGTEITGVSLEFVYPTYTVEYSNNDGTGSISSYNVGYNQSFKLSDGAGISKAGYELDNWCVLRKTHRNSYNDSDIMTEVFCTDGQWHEFKGAYATNTADAKWQTYNKNSTYIMDNAWVKGDWNNVFVFCAQWRLKKYSLAIDKGTGISSTEGQSNEISSGTWTTVSAKTSTGYTFKNWDIVVNSFDNNPVNNGTTYVENSLDYWLTLEKGVWRVVDKATNSNINWYTGLVQGEKGWFFARNGVFDNTYNGTACNEKGWYQVTNGAVNWKYTGYTINKNGIYWVENGVVQANRVYLSVSTDSTKNVKNYYYPMIFYYLYQERMI